MAGKVVYTADAHVQGGREGRGRTGDGALEVDFVLPGDGRTGATPEHLFALGFGACFENALRRVATRQKLEVDEVSAQARVHLLAVQGEGRRFGLAVELDCRLPGVDDDVAVQLVRAAHEVCPYSNATRGNIDVALTANGRTVE